MSLQAILQLLPDLTASELTALAERIMLLRSLSGAPPLTENQLPTAASVTRDDWVLRDLCYALASMGVEHASPAMLRRTSGYPSFKRKVPGLILYLQNVSSRHLVRRAILMLGVRLLHKELTRQGLAASSVLVLRHAHRIPSVINGAFPGYAASGMLEWISTKGASDVRKERNHPSVPQS